MGLRQRYRLRAASDREVVREVEPDKIYVDRETGEEFHIVGKVLPLAPSPSNLPWSVENLRMCGCSLEQLAPRDVNDCPYCGRRLPALARLTPTEADETPARGVDRSARQNVGDGHESGRDPGGGERAGHDPALDDESGKDPPAHEDAG